MDNYTRINDRGYRRGLRAELWDTEKNKKDKKRKKEKRISEKTICRPYKHIFTQYKPLETKTKTRKENKRRREREIKKKEKDKSKEGRRYVQQKGGSHRI